MPTVPESEEILARADQAEVLHVDVLLQVVGPLLAGSFEFLTRAREAESVVGVGFRIDGIVVVAAVLVDADVGAVRGGPAFLLVVQAFFGDDFAADGASDEVRAAHAFANG